MRSTILIIIAIILVIVTGCENKTILEAEAPTNQELEAIVKGNSITLLEAVESFAKDNYGKYPENADIDTTVTGKVLIDYLPNGERLINPYTGLRDQPVDSIPLSPGEIGYYKYHDHECIIDYWKGSIIEYYCYDYYLNIYYIKGYGANSIIIEHDNIEETEALVIDDCLELQRAVEAWHDVYNEFEDCYPCESYDSDQYGNTVSDYMPGRVLMENRFTLYSTEPGTWGSTWDCCVGMISYECIVKNDIAVGYTITGVGFNPGEYVFQLTVN